MSEVDQRVLLSIKDVRLSGHPNLDQLRPYCIIRVGDQHYRTDFFPPGSLELDCRRTTVDDRRARRSDDNHDGVLLTPHRPENVPGPGLDHEGCEEMLVIQLYNTADTETDSIDRFTPVALGELKLKLSDIWLADSCSQLAFGCVNSEIRESTARPVGSSESDNLPDPRTCDGVPDIQLSTIIDRWFGGIVSPRRREGFPEACFDVAVRLECRRFKRQGRFGVERSEPVPVHDSFGHAVSARNVRKCLSAQGLWELQESRQRERWNSETGQQAWSAFREDRSSVEPPRTLECELRELVWNGVPGNMREEVYMSLSGASSKRKLFESGKAIGYCHYTQLVNKCRKLEDESERIGVALEGTGRSKSRKDGQQATVVGDAGTDDGAAPKRGTCGDGDGTPSLANEFAADTPGTGCSMYGASHCCEERKGSPRAGQMNLETQIQLQVWWEIEADVDRVFINGKSHVNSAQGMASMRRLLRAFSLHNKTIGYCQGMNFVAGLLLEVVPEETAFWLLAAFCEDLHPAYHTKNMAGARSDIAALKDLIRRELPQFHSRACEVGIPLELKLTQWLLVGFVNCFPGATALRILEVSLLEGPEVYLAVALAFLRLHEREILKGNDIADVVNALELSQGAMYEVDILLLQVMISVQPACIIGIELGQEVGRCENTWSEAVEHGAYDQHGWLQGRSSTQFGSSAWLFLVPTSLAGKAEAVLSSLNKRTLTTTRGGTLADGKTTRQSLSLLLVGGCRWLLGLKSLES